ncbi:MAG: DUF177 domain-containing protein, partial [Nitrospiraceae bacterium]|nr:DUF177 domain-containing protein [Nitrospiraceae bacterium]
IKVSEIPEEGLDVSEEASVRINERETPARVEIHVRKTGPEVAVKGTVTARMELVCGRCLREFVREVSAPVDLVYRPVEEMAGESPELAMEEMDTGFYKADELDTGAIAAEQLILSTPIKVLCGDACKGICPGCGRDLNVEGCVCPPGSGPSDSKGLELKRYLENGKTRTKSEN